MFWPTAADHCYRPLAAFDAANQPQRSTAFAARAVEAHRQLSALAASRTTHHAPRSTDHGPRTISLQHAGAHVCPRRHPPTPRATVDVCTARPQSPCQPTPVPGWCHGPPWLDPGSCRSTTVITMATPRPIWPSHYETLKLFRTTTPSPPQSAHWVQPSITTVTAPDYSW